MPPKSSLKRKKATFPSPDKKEKIVKLSSPHPRTSRDSGKEWRKSGPVTRQTTLTQIDFVRRAERAASEDLDLEYEDEILMPVSTTKQSRKRKRAGLELSKSDDNSLKVHSYQQRKQKHEEDKENDIFAIPRDEPLLTAQPFTTPRKLRRQEVPSSQSPTTPLTARSSRKHVRTPYKSPLKEISANVKQARRLEVEDTFKTSHTLSSPGSVTSRESNTERGDASDHSPSKTPQGNHRYKSKRNRLEILDSDEELSDAEFVRSSQLEEQDDAEDTTILADGPPCVLNTRDAASKQLSTSDFEVMKPPISDDQDCATSVLTASDGISPKEVNTLDDALLTKPKRRYSNKKRPSKIAELSSSSLDRLSEVDGDCKTSSNTTKSIEIPSSPPLVPQLSLRSSNLVQLPLLHSLDSSFSISAAIPSDSQQVSAQIEQESQWQEPLPHPSQASTASIRSSPVKDANAVTRTQQSNSSRRGWFFNPLTDSQLLPDSIMNFELPKLPGRLAGRFGLVDEDPDDDL